MPRPNECDRCGARREVIDQVNGDDINACGWHCWAKIRFGEDLSDFDAAMTAIEYDVQPERVNEFLEKRQPSPTD